MRHREEAKQSLPSPNNVALQTEDEIPCEVIGREHNPFTETGSPRGIVEDDHFLVWRVIVVDIIGRKALRILL